MASIEEMLFGTMLQATGAAPVYRAGSALKNAYNEGEELYDKAVNNPSSQFALRQAGLVPPDPGPNPEVKTPVGPVGVEPPQINFDAMQQVGIQQSNRLMNQENHAKLSREANERADFARQGMQYYAPGIGFKGEFAKPGGQASAFGQSYTPTQGTMSSASAKGGEYSNQLEHEANMRQMQMQLEQEKMQRSLQAASMSPADAAKLNAIGRTQIRVDPVEQQAFKEGQRMIQMRQAAIQKALKDTQGDPVKFEAAKNLIDQQFGDFDYKDLLAWALGQRSVGANPFGVE